ncbi:PspA/IM30 family protein [Paenibacillus sp. IB182496]|uniref:PspA/IM30 family protein n=1 Tax=Paenibacillus sabuli TaxID=2772509 RepID=A0A927GRP0_9BACL|nr:PspA/IM30 family protein [Paenibacillus sabuli]MBD2844877.1 PspA/IM30 family protein [Paenibacillus sabuli]
MSMLTRFKAVMLSNWNALVDRADDPEKMARSYLKGLQADLGRVKAETATLQMQEQRARRALAECDEESAKLQRYAETCVREGKEAEALKFLTRKQETEQRCGDLQAALDRAAASAQRMRQMEDKLAGDVRQLEERRDALAGKQDAARAQQRIHASGGASGSASGAMAAWEEQVNRNYDEAMALAELRAPAGDDLDDVFAEWERERAGRASAEPAGPEDELAALRRRLRD